MEQSHRMVLLYQPAHSTVAVSSLSPQPDLEPLPVSQPMFTLSSAARPSMIHDSLGHRGSPIELGPLCQSSHRGEGHGNWINYGPTKVSHGPALCCPTWSSPARRSEQTSRASGQRKVLQRLIHSCLPIPSRYPSHKGKMDHRIYPVKVKVNPNVFSILFSHTSHFPRTRQTYQFLVWLSG